MNDEATVNITAYVLQVNGAKAGTRLSSSIRQFAEQAPPRLRKDSRKKRRVSKIPRRLRGVWLLWCAKVNEEPISGFAARFDDLRCTWPESGSAEPFQLLVRN
jgi:hypothetical protein